MLRVSNFLNKGVSTLQAKFSEDLDLGIAIENVRITASPANIEGLSVLAVEVDGDVLTITTSPQFPYALYTLEFISTDNQTFASVNGETLQEDGFSNSVQFLGIETQNEIRDSLVDNISPVFDVESDTLVRKYISNLANQLFRGRNDIREVGNSNYISVDVVDEIKVRGNGPTDRLDHEGAYEITRVGLTPEGTTTLGRVNFNAARASALLNNTDAVNTGIISFPSDPFSLRSVAVVEERVSNRESSLNSFSGLTLNLAKNNVAQLHACYMENENGDIVVYDIPEYGYSIASNRYDTVHGHVISSLESNQIRLASAAITNGDFELPTSNAVFVVSYSYIDNGIEIDEDTIEITETKQKIREVIGAFAPTFVLSGFPIVDSSGNEIDTDGVEFLDPMPDNGVPFSDTHPAFAVEIPFDETKLPGSPGEYAINYTTGQVFVYGESEADGTGVRPPVASYYYVREYVLGLDYDFDEDGGEIAANSSRDLIGKEVRVEFRYERAFAEGTDFIPEAHIEVIDEDVENRLAGAFRVLTQNTPITNVFRVSNETTGEIYTPTSFNDNTITFSGRTAPQVKAQANEPARFERVFNEQLFDSEVIEDQGSTIKIKLELNNSGLISSRGSAIGSNICTDVAFTQIDLFESEFFYDSVLQTVSENLSKINNVGEYLIDYENGIVYLCCSEDTEDFGEISYTYKSINTTFSNILAVEGVAYKKNANESALIQLDYDSFSSTNIALDSLPQMPERFLADNTDQPIVLGGKQYGTAGQRTVNSRIFVALDAVFEEDHADGNHFIRFADDSDRAIVSYISRTSVEIDAAFTDSEKNVNWCLIDFDFSDGYTAVVNYDIDQIHAVYDIPSLQSFAVADLVSFYDPSIDEFDGNVITFRNELIKSVPAGTALAVDYSFGTVYTDYLYVADRLKISYEYGDNSINFSSSTAIDPGQQYYCSYKYGALRESLNTNFGALTQLPELSSFGLDTDRELYRDAVSGALQAFVKGPTKEAIETAVSSITKVVPNITELSFNEWTLGRDYLYLAPANLTGEETYDAGKYGLGIVIDGDTTLEFPSDAYISHREGTIEGWVKPKWRGIDNDATITFDIGQENVSVDAYDGYGVQDGYRIALQDIYIGSSAFNPTAVPFTLDRTTEPPFSPRGRPSNFGLVPGYFIWYDEDVNEWMVRMVADPMRPLNFTGRITSSGKFYNVKDGYEYSSYVYVNEGLDRITSTSDYIDFSFYIDGYESSSEDGYVGFDGYGSSEYVPGDGYLYQDGINFVSDNIHYFFDTGASEYRNRISVYKDGMGYLNFTIYDSRSPYGKPFTLSTDISDWAASELHHIAVSWRLNSAEGIDELHLFVDGQEVASNFRYGSTPALSSDNLFRAEAREYLTTSAPKNIVGGIDGITEAGSAVFVSESADFVEANIQPGDSFVILDATADGLGGPYTVVSVDDPTTLTISSPLLLSLTDVSYSVNQMTQTVDTALDVERFAVFAIDSDGELRELNGVDSSEPDYTIEKSGHQDIININNNVNVHESVFINTLGLTRGRIRDTIYDFAEDNLIRTNLPPPFALQDVQIYKIIGKRAPIIDGGQFNPGDGYGDGSWSLSGTELSGTFTNLAQPSNRVVGKKLKLTLGGQTNIDFSGTNEVVITGESSGGPTSETITFTNYESIVSTTLWTDLTSFSCTFTGRDTAISFGSLEIIENTPLTASEGGGDYATVASYNNGEFELHTFGSGGLDFNLAASYYLLDYPVKLSIKMDAKGPLFIGSDLNGENQWNGLIEEFAILNEMLLDVRAGEEPASTERSITADFNSNIPLVPTAQTTMLMHFNGNLENDEQAYISFGDDVLTSSQSVNDNFGDCAVFLGTAIQEIDNAEGVIDNDHGTIEFWVSPIIDTLHDEYTPRYYIDMCAVSEEISFSQTKTRAVLSNRASRIVSVRLATDDGTGTDYFDGGELSIDGRTITLGTPLPKTTTRIKISYISGDNSGNRLSIYKDGYGILNFEILSDTDVFKISYPIVWQRNTWHRVMATWDLNNIDNQDRMRLFVDGVQGGTVMYGSPGFNYGIGVLYGMSAVGTLEADFLTTNIDFTDTFPQVFVGNSFSRGSACMAKIDNLRFSNIVREPAIVSNEPVDLNYSENTESVLPVVEDSFTTAIYNYEYEPEQTEFLANLYDESTPLFLVDVEVIDSFDRINGSTRIKNLISSILNRLKPAHTRMQIRFEE